MSKNSNPDVAGSNRGSYSAGRGFSLHPERWRCAALAMIFVWFLLGGIGHFAWTDAFASVVPPYVPFPQSVVILTGLCEIAGALGLLSQRLRPAAGLGLMLFALCVIPVHVEMLRNAEHYPDLGAAALWARLVFQPVLVWIIWRATQPARSSSRTATG